MSGHARLLPIMAFALAARAGGQTTMTHVSDGDHRYMIRSSVNNLNYQLFVALPAGYSSSDTTRYPVLYALDGNDVFPLIPAVRWYLQAGGAMAGVIIVGVGYPDGDNETSRRRRDLTPSLDQKQDSVVRRGFLVRRDTTTVLSSGGAAAFVETFRRDVIPFIENKYRTRSERGLLGHSLGGLFVVYALSAAPELFDRYGIFSPATWWDRDRLLAELSTTPPPSGATGARVFVSAGTDEDLGMQAQADSVTSILKRVYGDRLTLTDRRFPGSHAAYFPEAVVHGLRFMFPGAGVGCLESLPSDVGEVFSVRSEPKGIVTERFVRTGAAVFGRESEGGVCIKYQLAVNALGLATSARLEQNVGSPRTVRTEVRDTKVQFTTTIPEQERSMDVPGSAALFVPRLIGSLDQMARLAPSRIGDSARVLLANFRHANTATAVITRIFADSIRIQHPNVELRVRISDNREILGGRTIPAGSGAREILWSLVRER